MVQCGSVPVKDNVFVSIFTKPLRKDKPGLTPAQQYAGEILSYLIPLILGQKGNPNIDKDWATRGLDEKLDFKAMSERMTNSDQSKTDLLVFDPNILGLTEVLYYYDKNLNLRKDNASKASIYPSPELIAIRLLLLQKIYRGEKIHLEAFIEREKVLTHADTPPTKEDFEAININAEEMQLLKDIFESAPYLYNYLKSHFLIDAFHHIGVIETDPYVEKIVREANYKKYSCRHFGGSRNNDAVKISFLPSIIREFHFGDSHHGLYSYGFKPTEYLNEMTNKMKREILDKTKSLMYREINKEKIEIKGKEWEALWGKIVKEKIAFFNEDERPLVIYPNNAPQVIQDVCPEADFSIILFDKNIYLSIYIDQDKDIYPYVNRFYIDITDIKYSQTNNETEQISYFIYSKLKDYLEEIVNMKAYFN